MSYDYSLGTFFSRVAAAYPGRPGIFPAGKPSVSFADLEALSNRFAYFLIDRGVERGQVVGIFHDKTPAFFALMLACLKIGAIYVNLDPDSPLARIEKILDCADPVVIAGSGVLRMEFDLPLLDIHRIEKQESFRVLADTLPEESSRVLDSDPAYLMFTSGSTGDPKGAVISHRAVMNFIAWSREQFRITDEDILTNLNPMFFDNSVFDFYASLFNGAGLVPISAALVKNPRKVVKAVEQTGCTIWFSVPSMLVYMLRMRALEKGDTPSLRSIVFGGEGFPKDSLRKLHALVSTCVELVNVYGPTECTCICSAYRVQMEDYERSELLPLGYIAPNFDYAVLGDQDEPVAPGSVGELCLKGPNVGLGYYRNPEQTAYAFVQNPGHRDYRDIFYRTGDLVFVDPQSGYLHFTGRKDHQIKKMGYRIELEEIEVALGSLAGVAETGCVYLVDLRSVGRIIAFAAGERIVSEALLNQLRELIPSYMIPDRLHVVAELPKNRNGKIDRPALKDWVLKMEE